MTEDTREAMLSEQQEDAPEGKQHLEVVQYWRGQRLGRGRFLRHDLAETRARQVRRGGCYPKVEVVIEEVPGTWLP